MTAAPGKSGFRTDIQALRTIAVGSVVLYHLYPGVLSGGFAGVDVFFVISGFLITSHLVSRPPQGFGDLARFWARRVRRLLPASLLVLLSTLVAAQIVAPATVIPDLTRMASAAATYWVNWLLAGDAIDYLRSEDAPTAVQHFWSLSVEEQFYAFWPILLLVLVYLARRIRVSRETVILIGLGAVTLASFIASIRITESNPSAAYFITWTRLWELGVGSMLAVWVSRPGGDRRPAAAPALAWLGLAAIVITFLTYYDGTPFPGYQAALPVLGTAAVILARPDAGIGGIGRPLARAMAWQPVQWVGAASYSIYLWHWPILILLPFVSGDLGLADKIGVAVLTVVLAGLTKKYVEDPARTWRPRAPLPAVFAVTVAAMAVVVGCAQLQADRVQREVDQAVANANNVVKKAAQKGSCLGVEALGDASCPAATFDSLVAAPAAARLDRSQTHDEVKGGKQCAGQEQNDFELVECVFGDEDSSLTVTLAGDSHAQQWLPALQQLATERPFKITTRVSSGCNLAGVRQLGPTPAWTDGCERWAAQSLERILTEKPDLLVISNRTFRTVEGQANLKASRSSYTEGATAVLQRLADADIPTLVIRDTPIPSKGSVPACIDEHHDDLTACDGTRKWIKYDAWEPAVAAVDSARIRLIDVNDHLCTATACPAVIGNMIAYYDNSHLTATLNRTLAPTLEPAVADLIGEWNSPAPAPGATK